PCANTDPTSPTCAICARAGEHADSRPGHYYGCILSQRVARGSLQTGVPRARRRAVAKDHACKVGGRRNQAQLRTGRYIANSAAAETLRCGEVTRTANEFACLIRNKSFCG